MSGGQNESLEYNPLAILLRSKSLKRRVKGVGVLVVVEKGIELPCPESGVGLFAVYGDGGGGGEPGFAPVEGRNRLQRGIFRKQRQKQLLHGIAVIMTGKGQIHGLTPYVFSYLPHWGNVIR